MPNIRPSLFGILSLKERIIALQYLSNGGKLVLLRSVLIESTCILFSIAHNIKFRDIDDGEVEQRFLMGSTTRGKKVSLGGKEKDLLTNRPRLARC